MKYEVNNEKNLERLLREICFQIKREGRKALKEFDISPAQFDVMQIIYFRGQQKLSDISKIYGVTKSTTTGLIQRLEILKLIKKKRSVEDKRVYNVELTSEGKNIIEKVILKREELMKKVCAKMGKDTSVIEKLIELKTTMKEVIDGEQK